MTRPASSPAGSPQGKLAQESGTKNGIKCQPSSPLRGGSAGESGTKCGTDLQTGDPFFWKKLAASWTKNGKDIQPSQFLGGLQRVLSELQEAGSVLYPPLFVSIDGRCGGGTSTLARALETHLEIPVNVLHMDDFFLPPERRTPQRLSLPGGNMDLERCARELLDPLSRGKPGLLRPFDCHTGTFLPETQVPPRSLTILEGTYSAHPELAAYPQLRLFLTCSPQVQLARLERREGPERLRAFREIWIPREEAYFKAFRVPEGCDLVMDTTDLDLEDLT